jgi:uncharacterized protein (DUF58 family)
MMIGRFLKKTFRRWLKRRIPRQKKHTLQHRNIFIVPSKTGLLFLFVIFLLWLLGINYQNNLVLGVCFLLLALLIVCMHHTFGNLSGLEVSVVKTEPGFVGEEGRVELLIKKTGSRNYEAVEIFWPEGNKVIVSLVGQDQTPINLTVPLKYRGWYQPERLHIKTYFPLGLIVAWSYLDLDAPILAYPQVVNTNIQPTEQILDDSDDVLNDALIAGHEEFAGLREYAPGDSLRNIDWRVMARGQGLATRIYEDYVSQFYWLDWQQFDGMSREARLSRLCHCVLQQADQNIEYGLRLPNLVIEPSLGESHQKKLLETLALFEWEMNQEGKTS